MPQLYKAGAMVIAFSAFALAAPAYALSPLPLNDVAPIAIPVIDEGTAIEELERPNEVAPGSQEGTEYKKATPEVVETPSKEYPEGDEEQEMKREFPSTEYPPE